MRRALHDDAPGCLPLQVLQKAPVEPERLRHAAAHQPRLVVRGAVRRGEHLRHELVHFTDDVLVGSFGGHLVDRLELRDDLEPQVDFRGHVGDAAVIVPGKAQFPTQSRPHARILRHQLIQDARTRAAHAGDEDRCLDGLFEDLGVALLGLGHL